MKKLSVNFIIKPQNSIKFAFSLFNILSQLKYKLKTTHKNAISLIFIPICLLGSTTVNPVHSAIIRNDKDYSESGYKILQNIPDTTGSVWSDSTIYNDNYFITGSILTPSNGHDIAIWKYDKDFNPRNDFNGKNYITLRDVAGGGDNKNDRAYSILIHNEKILIAGYSKNLAGNADFLICRLYMDGTLDNTFSSDGCLIWGRDEGGNNDDS